MEFSVLMPIYIKEDAECLNRALESILILQTVIPNEVVIIEDGQLTSELYKVLDSYEEKFSGIIKRYHLEKNHGMGYAMNYGLEKASFEWVFRMDSDDIARKHRFETQLRYIHELDVDIIGSDIEEFDREPGDKKIRRAMPSSHADIIKMMKYRNPINHMTVAFNKKKALKAGGYWPERFFEDYNLWYEMKKIGVRFYNIDQVLVDARIGNNMVGRRRGYQYFVYEKILLDKFKADNFINLSEYYAITGLKFVSRMIPAFVLRSVYKLFLREKA